MRKLIMVLAAAVAAGELPAAPATNAVPHGTGRQRMEARARRIAAEGGMVRRPYAGKHIVIVNDQKRIAERDFFAPRESFMELFQFPTKVVPPKTDVKDAAVVITLSDNATAPTLVVAPEIPWAGVNVGALAADKPDEKVLLSRFRKELWRAFMFACGAANSQAMTCVMRPVFGLRDLDAQDVRVASPESLPRVMRTARTLGIGELASCTYRQACQEGWASAPTNDIQKAIWDKVHEIPSKPIKIEYNEKRDKGK